MYINKLRTIQRIKNNIEEEIQALKPEILTAVMYNVVERAHACEAENMGHSCGIIVRF